jgi:poly(3-hydroxybutyrate) depolymerase
MSGVQAVQAGQFAASLHTFGVSAWFRQNGSVPGVEERSMAFWPFCTLLSFTAARKPRAKVLIVTPLSGHYAFITREMVIGLLPRADVHVTGWLDASRVPASAGDFGFDENIAYIRSACRLLAPGLHVIALCQGVVPALASAALLAGDGDSASLPRSLILTGGPADPLASPARVGELLRQRPLDWFRQNVLDEVPDPMPGSGRMVYPAFRQAAALQAYLFRHLSTGGELWRKVVHDDGLDPVRYPFLEMFNALMDLPARYFLENIERVFQRRCIWEEGLYWRGRKADFTGLRQIALMTVEGAHDDIAVPGQTSAAHRLCPGIPDTRRASAVVPEAGHFSLFHGSIWRRSVLPEIEAFMYGRA